MSNTVEPIRPESRQSEVSVTKSVAKTVRERLATIEQDKKTSSPWPEVKRRILRHPIPD